MDTDDGTPFLQCDIELSFNGPTPATLNLWAAQTLRRLADMIEKDEFDTGHHVVKDSVGKPVGTIYLDHFAELTR